MKVLFVNATQSRGGAARAMQRIAKALREAGAEVRIAMLEGPGGDGATRAPGWTRDFPIVAKAADRFPVLGYPDGFRLFRTLNFSPAWRRSDDADFVDGFDADIVNLHWVNYGFLSPEGIASLRRPVVWTMHDMWPFTGGCHYAGDCTRYTDGCGTCPVLHSRSADDLSSRLMARKRASWRERTFSIVSPSRWLADCARAEGSVFARMPASVIANPVDTAAFAPDDRAAARRRFNLPVDAPLILFGAQRALRNPLKGYDRLRAALTLLAKRGQKPQLVVFGAGEEERGAVGLDLPVHLLGHLGSDADIAAAYRAADVFVLPSSQDNLPNTVAEALCCGTPVAAFRIGGIPDMVRDGENGQLAAPFDIGALADAIATCIEAGDSFRMAARASAEVLFDPRRIAQAYLDVYRQALARG